MVLPWTISSAWSSTSGGEDPIAPRRGKLGVPQPPPLVTAAGLTRPGKRGARRGEDVVIGDQFGDPRSIGFVATQGPERTMSAPKGYP
jgi:hypothetical protein